MANPPRLGLPFSSQDLDMDSPTILPPIIGQSSEGKPAFNFGSSDLYSKKSTVKENPVNEKTEPKKKKKKVHPEEKEKKKDVDDRQWSMYEKLVYNLNILVPEEPPSQMLVPPGHRLQEVILDTGKKRVRVLKDSCANLPDALIPERRKNEEPYVVLKAGSKFPILDTTSEFLKKWDILTLVLLLYTACVTPFEAAFLTTTEIDLLFLVNRAVDLMFLVDMVVQARTAYRDSRTGKLVRNPKRIFIRYLKTWAFIDLLSIIPFEVVNIAVPDLTDGLVVPVATAATAASAASTPTSAHSLAMLRLLRFLRLARLLKLLRVLRASKKLKKWQVYINLRYASLQTLKYGIMVIFVIHWIACGYRMAGERTEPTEAPGWVDNYHIWRLNELGAKADTWELYLLALYWSAATIGMIGTSFGPLSPTSSREFGYEFFTSVLAYAICIYFIATVTDVLSTAKRDERAHELLVDSYLAMFDRLKLDKRLKRKVHDYVNDHYAASQNSSYTRILKNLPSQLHGFITMEIFMPMLEMVPYLEPFIDREPSLMQDLCRGIEIVSFPPNSLIFSDGYQGIYYVEMGLLAFNHRLYREGAIFGRSCLREKMKSMEARAITTVTVHLLRRDTLLSCLDKFPKIRYYAKRWTAWCVLRRYILSYARLYQLAARRGAKMNPPLLSRRPNLADGEWDDIDLAVQEHMQELGF